MIFKNPEYLLPIMAAGNAIFFGYLILSFRGEKIFGIFGGRKQLTLKGSRITGLSVNIFRGALLSCVFVLFASAYWLSPQVTRISNLPVYEGAEICFAVDASRSSLARDISFVDSSGNEVVMSRFDFAKKIVLESKNILSPDDTPCLIFFAASAINTVPILYFNDVAWSYINLDMKYADEYFIEHEISQGSDFVPMMGKVLSAFSDKPRRKIALIISDGEQETGTDTSSLEEGDIRELLNKQKDEALVNLKKEIAEFSKKYVFSVDIIGIGDIKRASKIPKRIREDGSIDYHTFVESKEKGRAVLTRPDPGFLFRVSQSLGGRYRHVNTLEEAKKELNQIFEREKKILYHREEKKFSDVWWHFVLAGTVLLFVVPFLKSP